jgi:hypothetical protein
VVLLSGIGSSKNDAKDKEGGRYDNYLNLKIKNLKDSGVVSCIE